MRGYADIGTPGEAARNHFVFASGPTTTISSRSMSKTEWRGLDSERDVVLLDGISVQKDVCMTSEMV